MTVRSLWILLAGCAWLAAPPASPQAAPVPTDGVSGPRLAAAWTTLLVLPPALVGPQDRGRQAAPSGQRSQPRRAGPARGDGGGGQGVQDALKTFVRENVPAELIETGKQYAAQLPEHEKVRLKQLAREKWSQFQPLLGDDPNHLTACLRKAMSMVSDRDLAQLNSSMQAAMAEGGAGAGVVVAELMAMNRSDLVPMLQQFIENNGKQVAQQSGGQGREAGAFRGVAAALSVEHELSGPSGARTRQSLGRLARLQLGAGGGDLLGWAKQNLPAALKGTAAETSDATVLAAALVSQDLDTLMDSLPLVHTPFGDAVPPGRYLDDADPADSDGILKALQAVKASVQLRRALQSGRDLGVVVDDFNALARGENER